MLNRIDVQNDPVNFVDPLGLEYQGRIQQWLADGAAERMNPWAIEQFTKDLCRMENVDGVDGDSLTDAVMDALYLESQRHTEIVAAAYGIGLAIGPYAARGTEITKPGTNGKTRVAPFGNRTGNKYGKWPHYHRAKPDPNRPGRSLRDQSHTRHRPWESRPTDKSWRDRF